MTSCRYTKTGSSLLRYFSPSFLSINGNIYTKQLHQPAKVFFSSQVSKIHLERHFFVVELSCEATTKIPRGHQLLRTWWRHRARSEDWGSAAMVPLLDSMNHRADAQVEVAEIQGAPGKGISKARSSLKETMGHGCFCCLVRSHLFTFAEREHHNVFIRYISMINRFFSLPRWFFPAIYMLGFVQSTQCFLWLIMYVRIAAQNRTCSRELGSPTGCRGEAVCRPPCDAGTLWRRDGRCRTVCHPNGAPRCWKIYLQKMGHF